MNRAANSFAGSILLPILFAVSPAGARDLAVHAGKAPLLDGRISASEWDDTVGFRFTDGTRIFAKRNGDYYFIAVVPPVRETFGVDLHVKQGDTITNLHASAKLGERMLVDGKYPDWQWWNHQGWTANVGRIGDFQPRVTFLPDEAKEFQIAVTRFALPLQLRVERHSSAGTAVLPGKDSWITLK